MHTRQRFRISYGMNEDGSGRFREYRLYANDQHDAERKFLAELGGTKVQAWGEYWGEIVGETDDPAFHFEFDLGMAE